MGCLYIIKFPSGKNYIGWSSLSAEERFSGHKAEAACGSSNLVHKAIRKYKDFVKVETLVIADDFEYLKDLETKAIKLFNTKAPNGYNMTDGGEGVKGLKWTDEQRAVASKIRKGRLFCPESTARLPEINRGRKRSEELQAHFNEIHSSTKFKEKMSVINATEWARRLGRPFSELK